MIDDTVELSGVFEQDYEVLSLVGRGGCGAVHKARQRTTGQMVAIKTVLPRSDAARAEKMLARFMRETRLCAQLYHPNIVQLINAGKTAEGELYTVFVYAPGKNLAQVLDAEGALEPEEARHLMLQVLDALACAHACGIVHRDLKPGNIMVITTGARRNALVLDFGIGTIVKEMSSPEYERLTGTAEILGTPGYASPEQLNGIEASAATDLFAWGLVFIECLTGQPVYSGASLGEILYKQLSAEPVKIPVALQHHPLGKLLEEVTRKDPAARPKDTAALVKRLEACSLRGVSRAAIAGDAAVLFQHNFVRTMTIMGTMSDDPTMRIAASERRQVTALCCTLELRPVQKESSSPEASTHVLDVEEQNRSLVALFDICTKVVQAHRGFLVATFGEQALFFFGYPQVDEQDGKRAARAALALQAAMATENERLQKRGLELAARIGIHSGLIVAPHSPDTIDASLTIGVTPTIAARVTERASPGSIVVSGGVQRLLRSAFDFEAQGVLDESSERLKLFRMQGEHTGGTLAAQSDKSAVPLVGRESELKLLVQRWEQAQQGAGQCSLISGEPGIGKSRLTQALRERIAEDPHVFLSLRASPDAQNSPLFPVIELVERLLDRESKDANADKLARLESLLSRHGLDPSTKVPLMAALLSIPLGDRYPALDISPELQKKRTLEAIRLLLFAMAEARPVFLVVEDLHWVDPTTLELVGQMIEGVSSASVYMVFTARPEFSQTSLPTSGVLQISLSRLGSDDIEALVAELFEGRDFPEEVLKQIIKRTDGVPLFIEEFAQMLIESGVLVLRHDSYDLARPLRDSDIPSSLRDLLTSRLDRLGKAKETAQLAATLGREFVLSLLAATSERTTEDVQADLEKLQAAGLIQSKRKKDDKGYVFKHALIRDAAYESMSLAARRKVHARVAKTLEEKFAPIAEARPELLAQHHAAAEQKQEAIGYAQKAAAGALKRSAYTEAAGQVNQALPWLAAIGDENERTMAEFELYSLLQSAVVATAPILDPKVQEVMSRTLALGESLGANTNIGPALYLRGLYYLNESKIEKAIELGERIAKLAQYLSDTSVDIAAHTLTGASLWFAGRFEEARKAQERVFEIYDPTIHNDIHLVYDVDPIGYTHILLGVTLAILGLLDRAEAELMKAVARTHELNSPLNTCWALGYLGLVYQLQGDRERAQAVTNEAIDLADRFNLPDQKTFSSILRCWATLDVPEMRKLLDDQLRAGFGIFRHYYLSLLAEIESEKGDHLAAIDHVEEALPLGEYGEEHHFLSTVWRIKGRLLLAHNLGAIDQAEACYRRAIDVAQLQGAKTHELHATIELARVLRAKGRVTEAHEMLSTIFGCFTEGFETALLREARTLLEELNQLREE